jgi:hypothetical protein
MNGKVSLTTGVTLALMLATGLTAGMPGVGLRTASAQDQMQGTVADPFFRVDWTANPSGQGEARINGYVYNDYVDAAEQVQLRITELDASGYPIATFVEPIAATVPAFDRAYFDVRVPSHGAAYRLAVESYNYLEGMQ